MDLPICYIENKEDPGVVKPHSPSLEIQELSKSGSAEEAEALVDSLTIENTSLSEGNLSGLSSSDYQTLNELSQELSLSNEETEDNEIVVEGEDMVVHEEEVETEEVEVEIDQDNDSPEEILPDVKTTKPTSVPPLRPLTIAPKPAKVPLAVKPVGGQQLLLLQGSGTGQAIKLVSPQGQELNLTNIISSRPVALKPAFKTLNTQTGNISIVQQKPMVMKKILAPGQKTVSKPLTTFTKQGQHFMVVQKSDQQQLKLLQAPSSNITLPGPTKTITLQQAQEMGLLSNAKILQQSQSTPKQTVLLTKNPQKTIKLVPQVTASQLVSATVNTKTVSLNTVKTPTKILPAGSTTISKGPQRIIFKAAGTNQTIIPSGQLIQVAGTQTLSGGQLHQINIPGKGMQYIKFVTANPSDSIPTTSAAGTTVKTSASSAGNFVLSEIKPAIATSTTTSKIAPKTFKTTVSATGKTLTSPQMVVIPTPFGHPQPIAPMSKVAIPPNPRHNVALKSPITPPDNQLPSPASSPMVNVKEEVDANGMRPRKPCNCTKSQCLKLYCDCFANGEFCYMCNCMNCFNNLENEEHRNRAIKACLERNPHAFKPKIGKAKDMTGDQAIRKHTKGCNCKRSGCLKNYCECYEAKIACSNNCKCIGCRNIEDSMEKKTFRHLVNLEKANNAAMIIEGMFTPNKDYTQNRSRRSSSAKKQTINFITEDVVIEATCQCMLTISDNAEENMQDEEMTKRLIIEEFGRCLTEIIDCSASRSSS